MAHHPLSLTPAFLRLLVSLVFVAPIAILEAAVRERSGQEDRQVEVWWSSELLPGSQRWFTSPPAEAEIRFKLDRQPDLSPVPAGAGGGTALMRIDPSKRFQDVLGIGTSLEGTSIYAFRKGRDRNSVKAILRSLIDPKHGLGFSLFRVTIGTSDFSDGRELSSHPKGFYSYRDRQEDEFSIEKDIRLGIIETLQLALEVARELDPPQEIKFFASCWSPPPWMKTSGELIGGTLKPGYEKALAKYFRQFIETYEKQGIPIYAMTLQNEPNFVPSNYPGMKLSREQELALLVATWEEFHLHPGEKPELQTKLWINDHNFGDWKNADFVLSELERTGRAHYVDAVAFHNYDGSPAENMTKLHERHPGADMVFTEHSEWGTAGMFNIQQYFWNWSRSYVYWVPATTRRLDEHNQSPYNRVGELGPTLLIEESSGRTGFYKTPEYYLLGQFSRFVRPGAVRIECDRGDRQTVSAVCFQNSDSSIAVVVVNQNGGEVPFELQLGTRSVQSVLPAKTVGTYIWR